VPVRLRISSFGPIVHFTYALPNGYFQPLLLNEAGKALASEASNQFTGVVIGPYASTSH
jgi:xylan 1,4-beta-xylosidase